MTDCENPFMIVEEQKGDDALWLAAETANEAYLQRALKRLHAALDQETWPPEGEKR